MTYITECKAPDISDLGESLLGRTITSLVFQGRKPPDSSIALRLLTGFLVVTDKAIREYSAGRATLIEYSGSQNTTRLFVEGLGRFETCIHSAKRGFRFLERMGSQSELPSVSRTLRKLMGNWEKSITPIRNAIEHIDDDIAAETALPIGTPHLLAMNHEGDCLEIARHNIKLDDLAKVLRALHRVARELLEALPPSGGTSVEQ
jgi:hypothetical protein